MAYNGSGTFTLVAGNPVVTGTTISSTWANNTLNDIATGLSTAITKDGQTTPTANIPMGGYKITGLGAPTVNGDALRYENISNIQAQTYTAFTTAGTTTAYTLTPTPAFTALAAGQRLRVKFNASNTTATPTLAVSGLTATALKVYNSSGVKVNPQIGAFAADMLADVEYDGTDYVVLDQLPYRATRIDVASVAGTVDLTTEAPNSDDIRITGALAITAFTVAAGRVLRVTAGGAATLTNNASIVTNTGENIVLRAGDTFALRATAANVVEVLFLTRAALQYELVFQSSTTYGSDASNKIKRYANVLVNQGGDAMTATDSATAGLSVTINIAGKYAYKMDTTGSSNTIAGVSVNSNQLTTSIFSITAAHRLGANTAPGGNVASVSGTRYFAVGDVIRSHTDGQAAQTAAVEQFSIIKVDP